MSANDFMKKVDDSLNIKFIITGLAGLIEDEGYTFHEAMEVLEEIKRNTFPALLEMQREAKENS